MTKILCRIAYRHSGELMPGSRDFFDAVVNINLSLVYLKAGTTQDIVFSTWNCPLPQISTTCISEFLALDYFLLEDSESSDLQPSRRSQLRRE